MEDEKEEVNEPVEEKVDGADDTPAVDEPKSEEMSEKKTDFRKEFFELKEDAEKKGKEHEQEKSRLEDSLAKLTDQVTRLTSDKGAPKQGKPDEADGEEKDGKVNFSALDRFLGLAPDEEKQEEPEGTVPDGVTVTKEQLNEMMTGVATEVFSKHRQKESFDNAVRQLDSTLAELFPGADNDQKRTVLRERVSKTMEKHSLGVEDAIMLDREMRGIAFSAAMKSETEKAVKTASDTQMKELAVKMQEAGFDETALTKAGLIPKDTTQEQAFDKMADQDVKDFERLKQHVNL